MINTTRNRTLAHPTWLLVPAALLLGLIAPTTTPAAADELLAVQAPRLLCGDGRVLENATVIIRDGKVAAVGADLPVPADARLIDFEHGVITPGLIDACCAIDFEIPQGARSRVNPLRELTFWQAVAEYGHHHQDTPENFAPQQIDPLCPLPEAPPEVNEALVPARRQLVPSWAEHASEVTPHRRVLDSINLLSQDFNRLAREGVTTVYVTPDSANVIGARGAILKTAGPLANRVLKPAADVKVSLGGDPSSRGRSNDLPPYYGPNPTFSTRRPTTRMGVEWVFRKAFYDAMRARDGLEPYGADAPPAEAVPALLDILNGRIPLRVQARMQHDIYSAVRLAREFGLSFILEEATEAYRCLPLLKQTDIPVIFGPTFFEPTGWRASYAARSEVERARLNTPTQLAGADVEFALTAQEMRGEEGLVRQGMFAVRHGLSPDHALRAITSTPARLLGLQDQVGKLAEGAAADLVVWNSDPFDATSRPLLVIIDGQVVHEN